MDAEADRQKRIARIRDNWDRVVESVERATSLSGRAAKSVTVVGVTKYVDAELTRGLVQVGCLDLGESRPQSLWDKSEKLAELPIRWHMIGHMQRNKVKRTLPILSLLQSLDSERLFEQVAIDAESLGIRIPVLLEVNVTSDQTKTGVPVEKMDGLMERCLEHPCLELRGIMGMASLEGGSEQARRDFAAIRSVFERLRSQHPSLTQFNQLSMGMSGDFIEAIQEGSTMVRIGSALFEGVVAETH